MVLKSACTKKGRGLTGLSGIKEHVFELRPLYQFR